MANPEPGQGPEGDLQRAGPVDADGVWVFALPVSPLREDLGSEAALAGGLPALGQRNEVLVTVQLPDDFVVADLIEVEEWDLIPGFAGDALVVYGVEVPVDGGTKIEIRVAEQVEAVLAEFFSLNE